jgi:hypothetical protein
MRNKYRLLFKKIDDDVITLRRNTLHKKKYVNKREVEIKNRPVFVVFKTQLFMIYQIVVLLLPLIVYRTYSCLNSKFPPPVDLCWQNSNISKLGILITKVGNIIIL